MPAAKSSTKIPKPARQGILINRRDASLGPYTEAQIAEMLQDGIIVSLDLARRSGETKWQPLYTLGIQGCHLSASSAVVSSPQQPSSDNQSNLFLQTLEIQVQLKSKSVAVLLALFLPFFGCLYSAPLAAICCCITGTIFFAVGVTGLSVALFSISYIVSIFRAIAGVNRFNSKLINELKAKVSVPSS